MGYYQTRYKYSKKRNIVWQEITRFLQVRFQLSGRVLDAGSGYGDFINSVPASDCYAFDIDPQAEHFLTSKVEFKIGKLNQIGSLYPPDFFDFVFSSNVLEHLPRTEIAEFFSGAKSILKKGGRLGILMPNYRRAYKEYFDDYTHVTPLSDVSLTDWMRASGFGIDFVHPGFMPYSVKDSRLPITRWLIRTWILSPWKPGGKQMLLIGHKP